jgi:hypothetical protein
MLKPELRPSQMAAKQAGAWPKQYRAGRTKGGRAVADASSSSSSLEQEPMPAGSLETPSYSERSPSHAKKQQEQQDDDDETSSSSSTSALKSKIAYKPAANTANEDIVQKAHRTIGGIKLFTNAEYEYYLAQQQKKQQQDNVSEDLVELESEDIYVIVAHPDLTMDHYLFRVNNEQRETLQRAIIEGKAKRAEYFFETFIQVIDPVYYKGARHARTDSEIRRDWFALKPRPSCFLMEPKMGVDQPATSVHRANKRIDAVFLLKTTD